MSLITKEVIETVAALARLSLTDDEKQRYTEQLSAVFDYFMLLEEVDTSTVNETSQVTGLQDVIREDVVVARDEQTVQRLRRSFPETTGGLLSVKAIFTESE